jgi:hypothetical protein
MDLCCNPYEVSCDMKMNLTATEFCALMKFLKNHTFHSMI